MVLDAEENTLMYICLYQLDDLMEKLKILNYERLLSEMKMKPLGRYYFLKSVNPGEQFFMFTSLCAWLIRQSGRAFEQPQEFHDPSLTIANIVKVLQEMVCRMIMLKIRSKFPILIYTKKKSLSEHRTYQPIFQHRS